MRLRELNGWPPALTETYDSRNTLEPSAPGLLKRCMLFTTVDRPAYLSIVVTYKGRDWHAMLTDQPEPLLRRIEATLRGHEGETLAALGDLELVGGPPR